MTDRQTDRQTEIKETVVSSPRLFPTPITTVSNTGVRNAWEQGYEATQVIELCGWAGGRGKPAERRSWY